jgi:hypothetical protein
MPLLLLAQIALAWGEASESVAIGAARTDKELRVHFRNTGSAHVAFAIGGGETVHVQVTARNRLGRECRVLNLTGPAGSGYIEPLIIRLAPGAQRHVSIPLDKLICVDGGRDWTLSLLFARGYTARVSFTVTAETNAWAKLPSSSWTGTIKSGEIP